MIDRLNCKESALATLIQEPFSWDSAASVGRFSTQPEKLLEQMDSDNINNVVQSIIADRDGRSIVSMLSFERSLCVRLASSGCSGHQTSNSFALQCNFVSIFYSWDMAVLLLNGKRLRALLDGLIRVLFDTCILSRKGMLEMQSTMPVHRNLPMTDICNQKMQIED